MKLSFTARLALSSLLTSALAFGIFTVFVWRVVGRSHLERLDQQILETGHRHLMITQDAVHWRVVDRTLNFLVGQSENNGYMMLVKDGNGAVLRQSPYWPGSLDPSRFPRPPELPSEGFHDDGAAPPRGGPPLPGFNPSPDGGGPPRNRIGPPPDRMGPAPNGPRRGPPEELPLMEPELFTWREGDVRYRVGVMGNPYITLVLGLNMEKHDAAMATLRTQVALVALGALALVALGSWWIARRAMGPIAALTAAAEALTAKDLNQRLPEAGVEGELKRLIAVFNGMLERLELSFQQASRFSADAAHELKTPLMILQGDLERGVREAPMGSDQQQRYTRLLDEVQRLKGITRKLLLLSLADAGNLRLELRPTNLSDIVGTAVDDAEVLDPTLRVESQIAPNVTVMADEGMVRQVLQNLVSNAVKYNGGAGRIRITLKAKDARALLTVTNSGPGIPKRDHPKVFNRFYRGDGSHNRRTDGVGLGLSLSREIARAHGGELALMESRDECTVFRLTIPLAT